MRYLTAEEIIALNDLIIKKSSPDEMSGVKEPTLLDSAIQRPRQSAFGEDAYPSIFEKASALFESIAKNHCFHNANKRTAFICMLQFLSYNDYTFSMPEKEAEDFVVDVVNHEYNFDQIVATIKKYTI